MTATPAPARRIAASVATLLGYVALVVWLTWPLGAHLATHLPSINGIARMDTLHSLWVLSWESHALATHPAGFLDANIYYPAPDALLYSTMGLATLPYFAPTFLATANPVLAANLAFLACVALAAWGVHHAVMRWSGSWLGGVVAGCCFLLTPWVLWTWMPARPIHVVLVYLPWIVVLTALPGWRRGRAVLLGLLIALQCMVDPIYVAPAVLLPVGCVALWRFVRRERGAAWGLTRALALALVAMAPIYACYAVVRARNPSLFAQSAWAKTADARTAVEADGLVLAGGIWADLRPTGVPWVVVPLVALGLLSFLRRPRGERAGTGAAWRHAALWVVVGLLISTRSLVWPGDPTIVVPSPVFMVLDALVPQVSATLRGTVRLSVAAMVGIALLAGLAFAECARRLPGLVPAVALAALIVAAMYVRWPGRGQPYPVAPAPASRTPVIEMLRSAEGPVLELPAGMGALDTMRHAEAMYRSTFHWRPLLNGYGSYWPVGFPERMALAARLPDADALAALRAETGVDAVLVHRNDPHYAAWLALSARDDGPLRLVVRDGDDLLFAPAR